MQPPRQNFEALEGMTEMEFLGKPKITSNANAANMTPGLLTTHEGCTPVPFVDRWATKRAMKPREFKAVYCEDGAAVSLGDQVIASYFFGDHLVVDKKYRRQGIGAELVYQFRTRYPEVKPAKTRTRASQELQVKVWDRISLELCELRWAKEALDEVENVTNNTPKPTTSVPS